MLLTIDFCPFREINQTTNKALELTLQLKTMPTATLTNNLNSFLTVISRYFQQTLYRLWKILELDQAPVLLLTNPMDSQRLPKPKMLKKNYKTLLVYIKLNFAIILKKLDNARKERIATLPMEPVSLESNTM